MTNLRQTALLLILGTLASGCLVRDEDHTWYVDQAGHVTWSITEKDVRSDAQAILDRLNEESAYWSAVKSDIHPMARGLRLLGADAMRTRAVRAEAPFTVVTEGRFAGLDELGQRLIVHSGLTGSSVVRQTDGAWEWTMTARDPHADQGATEKLDDGLSALLAALDRLKIVLVTGRFESTTGFDLSSDRRVAVLKTNTDSRDDPVVSLGLKWR